MMNPVMKTAKRINACPDISGMTWSGDRGNFASHVLSHRLPVETNPPSLVAVRALLVPSWFVTSKVLD